MPVLFSALLALSCGDSGGASRDATPSTDAGEPGWSPAASLPTAVGNNATAALAAEGGCMLFSALGIGTGLDRAAISSSAFRLRPGIDDTWLSLPDVPGPPRLAASAVSLRGDFYVLGGYEVAAGGAETSSELLLRFNQRTGQWDTLPALPTPIDDAVAAAWRDRYIVVVSGWSDGSNVSTVQLYDVESSAWQQATSFPGVAVFGHAGAVTGDVLLVVDGAASTAGFPIQKQVWRGDLDPAAPTSIDWTNLGGHPGPARYRAAAGAAADGRVVIHGGTDTPYNFDGLRYDTGAPAQPLSGGWIFDPQDDSMADLPHQKSPATMDHRAMPSCDGRLFTVGGLVDPGSGTEATSETWSLSL